MRQNIEEVIDVLSQNAGERNIELLADIDCQLPKLVMGDGMRLRQILLNLGSNAIKFTEKGHVLFKITQVSSSQAGIQINFSIRWVMEQCFRYFI